jgi:hypothetical protein
MNKELFYNLIIFVGICILSYIIFRSLNFKEGMGSSNNSNNKNSSGSNNSNNSSSSSSSSSNGVGGNAAGYGANIKSQVVKIQDTVLISKYRTDYENVIINMDDLVNNLMLETTLTIDQSKPQEGLAKLAGLNNAKIALNSVMKFIDSK